MKEVCLRLTGRDEKTAEMDSKPSEANTRRRRRNRRLTIKICLGANLNGQNSKLLVEMSTWLGVRLLDSLSDLSKSNASMELCFWPISRRPSCKWAIGFNTSRTQGLPTRPQCIGAFANSSGYVPVPRAKLNRRVYLIQVDEWGRN